jgi:drug/metabolite transporter (DMT)-like permease
LSRRVWMIFTLLSVLWGIPYLLIKVAVAEVSVPFLVFARTALGALIILPFVVNGRAPSQVRRHWRGILAFAVIEMIVPWGLLTHGETRIASSTAGLLIAATPILTVLFGRFSGDVDLLGGRRIAGLGLGFAGVFVLAAPEFGADLISILEVLAAAVCYALGSIVASRWLKDISPLLATGACLVVGALFYLPGAIAMWPQAPISLQGTAAIILLATLCTALAFAAFFILIREVGPDRAVVITYVAPAVAVAVGVAFLSEPLTGTILIAFTLILSGSVLATSVSSQRRDETISPRHRIRKSLDTPSA